jgi:hypothetical protein
MRILPQIDDAPEFIGTVEQVWFGSKWLGFSGKALGALAIWNKPYNRPATDIRIPPFVPHKIVS